MRALAWSFRDLARSPFAGRRARTVGVDARPGDAGTSPGRVDRRRVLSLIGAVPLALPVVARAANEPRFITLGMDVQQSRLPAGSAVFFGDSGEVSDMVRAGLYPTDLSGLTYADFAALRADPGRVAAAVRREREVWAARGLDRLPAAAAAPSIDDVGSGP